MEKSFSIQRPPRRALKLLIPVALAALLLYFVPPRMGVTPARVAKLHTGMTREEVQVLLGVPDDTTMYTGSIDRVAVSSEKWVYRAGEKRLTLQFASGRLQEIENSGF